MSLRKLSLKTLLINLMLLGLLFLGISIEAKAGQQSQAPFFDLATFKEIIEGAQNPVSISIHDEELIAQTADKIKDFLTSTNFAFNDHISHSILRNGQLFVEAFREIRIKFQIGHRNYSQIVDPKFRLDIVPNINFLKALIRVHAAALKDIGESAQKVLDVMAYADRNESTYAAILYHHCIQAAAVGVNHSNCVKDFNIQLSKDKAAIAKFERAYMITYRISRLVFAKFHEEIKLLGDPNIISTPTQLRMTIYSDPRMAQYDKTAVTQEQFSAMTLFNQAEIHAIPECEELKKNADVIHGIFKSQLGCTTGKLFGIDTCFRQHSEENRRKVIVPTIGIEFASIFFLNPERDSSFKSSYSTYRTLTLKEACKRKTAYDYDL